MYANKKTQAAYRLATANAKEFAVDDDGFKRPIISRETAESYGLTQYFTGKPCKHGHICYRNVKYQNCLACTRNYKTKWYRKQCL